MLVVVSCYSDLSVAVWGYSIRRKKIELGDTETLHNVEVAERPLCYREMSNSKARIFLSEKQR